MSFVPGSQHTGQVPVTVKPPGLACQAELYLGPDPNTKSATSGLVPFTGTGALQTLSLPVVMPAAGTYHVYVNISAGGLLFSASQGTSDMVVSTNTFGLNSGDNIWPESTGAILAMRFQNIVGSGTLTDLEMQFNQATASGRVKLAVYSDVPGTVTTRAPGTLLGWKEGLAGTDWIKVSGLNVPVANNAYYWLAFLLESTNNVEYASTGISQQLVHGAATPYSSPLPTTFPPITYDNDVAYVLRATVVLGAPPVTHNLNIGVTGSGTTNPAAGAYTVNDGDVVTISALPAAGSVFSGWSNGSQANPISLTITQDTSITAAFTPSTVKYQLTIGVSGSGSTTPAAGTYQLLSGTVVTIAALPGLNAVFSGWSNGVTANPITLTINQNTSITANFVPAPAGTSYYVSPSGNDSNPGSLAAPWRTGQHAANVAMGGSTTYFRGGTYNEHDINVANSGAPGAGGRIIFTSYPGEVAIFNCGGSGNDGWTAFGKSYITIGGPGFVVHDCWIGIALGRDPNTHTKATYCDITDTEVYNLYYAGVHLWNGTDHVNILRNHIHNGLGTGDATNNMYGIASEKLGEIDTVSPSSDHTMVDSNNVHDLPYHEGIDLHGGTGNQVTNNIVDHIGYQDDPNNVNGILCDMVLTDNSTPVFAITDLRVDGNTISRVNGNSIYVGLATNGTNRSLTTVSVSGNIITKWYAVAIHVFAEGSGNTLSAVVIDGNQISQHTGIYQWSKIIYVSGDVPVNGLTLTNNTGDGSGDATSLPEVGIHLDGVFGLTKNNNNMTNCRTLEIDSRIT